MNSRESKYEFWQLQTPLYIFNKKIRIQVKVREQQQQQTKMGYIKLSIFIYRKTSFDKRKVT